MATTVDTLLVRIEADMDDLKRALDKVQRDVDKSTQGIAGAFKRIGTAMRVAVAAVVVQQGARAGAALINLASDVEEMQGKSKVVFGAFRDETVAALEAFGDEVGRSTHELEGMASSIQDTFVPMGFARGEAAKLSVELTKLAVDVASFNNANDTETMEAFQSALVGNHETVRRFGVVITEATLKQELLRMGIKRTGNEVTNAEKVQARLNLIIAGTTDAQGDALRTAGSFANQLRGLKADLAELGVELGTIFLPIVTKIVGVLRDAAAATRTFLQSIGVLAKPIDEEMATINGAIAALTQQLNKYEDALESTNKAAKEGNTFAQGADTTVLTDKIADLNKQLDKQIELRNILASQTDIVEPSFTISPTPDAGSGGADPTLAPDLSEMAKALQAIDDQRAAKKDLIDVMGFENQQRFALAQAIKDGSDVDELKIRTESKLFDLKRQFPALAENELKWLAATQAQKDINARKAAIDEEKQKEYFTNQQARIDAGVGFVESQVDANHAIEKSQDALNAAFDAGAISAADYDAAMALLGLRTLELNPMFSTFQNGALQLADGVSSAFADMAMGAKVSLQDFENMFKDFVKQMLAQAIKLLIVNAILRALGVPLRYDGSGFKAGKGNPFGGAIQESATGGAMSRGRPYLVGERGPELIIPASSGTIRNAHDTRNAMKGGSTVVNQTINVETGVSQTVRAEMLSLLPVIKQDTLAAVADGKRRGGSFGQVLS
jgi:hypothetical protein